MKSLLLALALVSTTASIADARPWPGRPGPGPRPGPRGVVCIAQNLRGQRFEAIGRDRQQASRLALRQCSSVSARCRVIGCSFR